MKRIFQPFTTVIFLTIIWALLMVLWIIWFVGKRKEYRDIVAQYRPELLAGSSNWFVMVQGILLLLAILAGIYLIFIFWKKQADLYNKQTDALAQITHELKSPLASIQLHLETIRLRTLEKERLDRFMETMLLDTERLHFLINNLLLTARFERKKRSSPREVTDFSQFVSNFLDKFRSKMPEGSLLNASIDTGCIVSIDKEAMGTAVRNLLENALLYSQASPDITVSLERTPKSCLLIIRDSGIGIDKSELKNIFAMFYRVRNLGDTIKGSGLGLYIVKSVVSEHGGKVSAYSEGKGRGITFTIELPLVMDSLI